MLAVAAAAAIAADEHFDITRFQVEGNTLLPAAEVERLVAPAAGPKRTFADIQLAVEALQEGYRKAGYTTVLVSVPEQELAGGAVRLLVRESVISSITISGNEHFDEANIRASLVRLQVGRTPSLGAISESIQLANESPAKQVAVTLAEGDKPGTIDAKVLVTDNKPLRIITTLDNTGAPSSGRWRTGIALQHANLFNRDQVGTLAYSTSPDSPAGVNLRVYSAGYRIPLYAFGDSIDFIYGKSSVNSPSTSPVLGGLLGFTGKGDIYGLRWNHFLGRRGESTAKLVLGLDHKLIDSRCIIGGVTVSIAPPTPPIASCVPYTTTPLSITYSSQSEGVDQISGYSIGLSRNLPSGERYTNVDGRTDRYSYLTPGNRASRDGFMAARGTASVFKAFANGWQGRLAGSAQYTDTPLVSSEQFGLAGSTLVRGFQERAVAADSGIVANAELYTPELSASLGVPGQLRAVFFIDAGHGSNNKVGNSGVPSSMTISSMGAGLRYVLSRDFSLNVDLARVNNAGTSVTEKRGDWNAHLSASLAF
ncbi:MULTISPECIES: ShlB/FhaC/HecB family hemolysin secretion/activation protein [unclassified Polaromonas]|uniref:ShlB/FhaC/HecB family hemolysin secretion/activation protein n=1 Tax=unclassified Polaromonas TaxID=2638319 RepID=UPI000F0865AF|nr:MULTISPECIES: ShlB/FhaC/HecB family hemolysin secretion/activation protein [unclassified Polaromonas]AYQ30305.1 ShlB/FhaC/HecB family hemolysin secretion/activation protein [Polaromonas sp. SP1]QGJ18417.1 BamA/TamA family outer membrane protein [Polaromonas sp. Pch-P]